jgi:response regulator RpfG family c-di-GMP phosphodiesterase
MRLTAKEPTRVTITVGVAAFPTDATDKNDLIAAADTALYLGKQSGADRVVRADEVPRDMRDLRSTLDRLARAALLHPDDAPTVDSLVEQAARLTHSGEQGQDTVRDALLGVARSLGALDRAAIGHGERVGRLARLVAEKLGCGPGAANTVELAARLQSLEVVGSDELAAIASLREVDEIVRWHRVSGPLERAPLGAQIVAVANAYDTLVAVPDGPHADRRAAVDELSAAAGTRYSREVVKALAAVVGVKKRAPRRRRREDDLEPKVRGAA